MRYSVDLLLLRLLMVVMLPLALLLAGPRQALALEKASIQLKWLHHCQFAGYYMALEKGFYRDVGLDVTIREGGPAAEVEHDVVSGRADFGVGTSALLLNLAQGQDIVVLGQIFQHSPAIFLTPRETGIRSIEDMRGRRFMYSNQHGDMRALLKRHGVDEARIVKVPHHGDPQDLINGKADVMLAYSFNEPYVMEQAGIPYLTFSPLAFGIDFYGDNFFTTRKLVKERPEFVRAFREATLRGWRYALEHRVETVDLIHARYAPGMDRELLLFEAEQMDPLIQPVLVELGYQNLARWHRISETFVELGMLPTGFDPSPIMYAPKQISDYGPLFAVLIGSGAIIVILSWLVVGYWRMSVKLKSEVDERKRAEVALFEERQRLAGIIEGTNVGTWEWNVQTGETKFNGRWAGIIGYTLAELAPVSIETWVAYAHPDDLVTSNDLLARHFRGESDYYEMEARMRHRDGSWVWVLDRGKVATWTEEGKPCWMLGTHQDITERKRAEEEHQILERQLLQAQKLESLGVLAGGIAHDFNNILMAIIGNADLALMKLNPESPVITHLHQIEQAASRAADLAKQMLAYSGKGKFMIENLDLNRMLEEMQHMLEVSISRKVVLQMNLTPHIPTLEADASQVRQTIMNLVINASEAMGDNSGIITITTGCMEYDRGSLKDVWLNEDLAEGLYTFLEVVDTGCGMDSDTLSRIFDPFFTTKFTGRGLGMAAVLGIIRGHKGGILVSSEPGKGTIFRVLLPASGRPVEVVENQPAGGDWQGHGTVLLVDDEESVREIGTEMLRELGFTAVTAGDGKEAVDLFAARDDFVLVILDLTMPRMDGEQCLRALQRIRGDVKAVISSGYDERDVMPRFKGNGVAGFIQKPYRLDALRQVLKGVPPA
jgi:PAS domain S-box-containing protein